MRAPSRGGAGPAGCGAAGQGAGSGPHCAGARHGQRSALCALERAPRLAPFIRPGRAYGARARARPPPPPRGAAGNWEGEGGAPSAPSAPRPPLPRLPLVDSKSRELHFLRSAARARCGGTTAPVSAPPRGPARGMLRLGRREAGVGREEVSGFARLPSPTRFPVRHPSTLTSALLTVPS